MTDSSPIAETAEFVIKILSARPVATADLPSTIANIRQALERLGSVTAEPVQQAIFNRPSLRPQHRGAVVARAEPAVRHAVPKPMPAVTFLPEKPRRGRPRRVPAVFAPEPEAAPPAPAPQPRLLRRADAMATNETDAGEDTPAMLRVPAGAVRGVVKWYDGRAGKGALRLTGVSGDVPLEPSVLERSGIKRLYKDQEVEATVEEQAGRMRLVSLKLPGRSTEPVLNVVGGEVTGTVRRQPRPVTVEVKRTGGRQRSARAEAEQILGGVGRIKANRRLTP
ncbi:MAG TPA: hypothetical protein VM689_01215 [Aliidongia sp.]|nr:hypothetical protein [Aliidongia sp.]